MDWFLIKQELIKALCKMKYIWVVYSMQLVFLPNLLTFAFATNSRLSSQMKWHRKAQYALPGKGDIGQTNKKIGFILSCRSSAKLQKYKIPLPVFPLRQRKCKRTLRVASELVHFDAVEIKLHTLCEENYILNLDIFIDSENVCWKVPLEVI